MAQPPQLSDAQRQEALAKAAEARRVRSEVKQLLKMRSLTLGELFARADREPVVGKLKVLALLESLPGLGKVKARRLMDDIGISENRRVQGLGPQQRARLLEELG
jgi:transposase